MPGRFAEHGRLFRTASLSARSPANSSHVIPDLSGDRVDTVRDIVENEVGARFGQSP
jgi:hypothetical protein